MIDPKQAGVDEAEWSELTAACHELRVCKVIEETADARSFVLEIPAELEETFRYRAGQFLSFKIPIQGQVVVRSYSLSSSPECEREHKFTVKRIEDGRISNWMNDRIVEGSTLMVVPPAGSFVLDESAAKLLFFSGGSGITPVISLIKSALVLTRRPMKLVYANRDEPSIIFRAELEQLQRSHPDRLEVVHSLDAVDGFLDRDAVLRHVSNDVDADFYLCGPAAFMELVERAVRGLGIDASRVHIERFVSPHDHDAAAEAAVEAEAAAGSHPDSIEVVLDGDTHQVAYRVGERILHAARRAGLDPPFSCEEGYCSCCMAKLTEGEVRMVNNDCLTQDMLDDGWVLTCQSVCTSQRIRVEYPD